MGNLLLSGWAMLEECCAPCATPLMRSRDKTQEVCCKCQKDYGAKGAAPAKVEENSMIDTKEKEPVRESNNIKQFEKTMAANAPTREEAAQALEAEKQAILAKRRADMQIAKRADELERQAANAAGREQQEFNAPNARAGFAPQSKVEQVKASPANGNQAFGAQQVMVSLFKKQSQLCERLEREQDLDTTNRILDTLAKTQDMIDRLQQ